MARYDVVYILKNDYNEEELKYSIRSVVMNFPYRKIVIVGGCPKDIKPDIYIADKQVGVTKWERSTHSLLKALKDERLTENIWLFNDDFFVMDKMKEPKNYFSGSLEKRVQDLKFKNPRGSSYIRSLEILKNFLFKQRKDTLSFALHVPMLVNRANALSLFENHVPNIQMFRSLYGNYFEIECEYMKDVKIYDAESLPEEKYCSTSDKAFKEGKCGVFLKQYFATPTKYENEEFFRSEIREQFTEEGDVRYD